uniref:GCS light chain n=1 Tax=Oryzias melastigma TaxID=30732 RepID=A0A3B3BSK7_ORYME
MDPQNTEPKVLLSRAKTFRLHTGNLVNRSRMKKKCPCSTSEELRDCIQATMTDWVSMKKADFPDVLDCSLPEATDAITPEEREELKVSGQSLFMYSSSRLSSPACQTLAVSQLDSVIIAPPPPLEADQSLAHLQPAWEQLEALVRSQKIAAIGTSDLDKDLLEQLYNWAQVKPSSNQVNLASCCVMPPDLTAFAKEFDIQLLTHSDPKELMSAETFLEAMRDGAQDQSIADWRLEWVLRYSVIVKSRGIFKSKGYLVSAKRVEP